MALPTTWVKGTLVISSPQKPTFYNVFYYVPAAAPSFTADPLDDAGEIAAAMITTITTNLGAVLCVEDIDVGMNIILHKAGQPYNVSRLVEFHTGLDDDDEHPDFVACIIQKRTATAGRSGRGRWFLGPVPESLTDENRLTPGGLTAYSTVAADWKSAFNALGQNWNAQLYSPKTAALHPITGTAPNEKLGSIRGRQSKTIL